jgi:uncharacterized membrane protein YjjP (DUF1212 family)
MVESGQSMMVATPSVNEADLEPHDLIRQSHIVHRTGRAALAAGHGSYRVKAHMERVGKAVGLDRVKAHVALTEVTTTVMRDNMFRTEVSEVRTVGINADRLAELEHYLGDLPETASVEEVDTQITRIVDKPHLYNPIQNALAAGLACAAFAFLNGGGPIECLFALVAASVGQYARRDLIKRGLNQVGVTMLVAALVCGVYLILARTFDLAFGGYGQHIAGYVSALLFLIPGFPLVTSALDLFRLDFSAGISRLFYGLMILGSAAVALWAVSAIAGLQPQPMVPMPLPGGLQWALIAIASFVAVLGFAVIYNSPARMVLGAAVIGMICNVFRLLLINEAGWLPQAAAAVAALLVGLLARAIATPLGVPRLTISVPAVVIMVPGIAAYQAVFEANTGNLLEALGYAVTATFVVLSLAVGLGVARMLTDREWTFEQTV